MWRRWVIISATEQEQRLSLVDDWRHWCSYSWLKRIGAASIGRWKAVFLQKTVQTFPFHLNLNTCSSRSESSYFTFNALNFLLTMSLSPTSFFISIVFFFFLITWNTACVGEPIFPPSTCMINVWTCKLYDELALREVTYGHNSCMME